MGQFLTILLFLTYIFGFGHSIMRFVKKNQISSSFLERMAVNSAIGLAGLSFGIILINRIGIPLHWWLVLIVSLILPVYDGFRYLQKNNFSIKFKTPNLSSLLKIKKSNIYLLIALLISAILFISFYNGAFSYAWHEDGDPWQHAVGTLYVSAEKTYQRTADSVLDPYIHYLEPYPPTYDAIMGILHQTYQDVNWVMKFFNVLMIAFGHFWFYIFAKEFMRNKEKALIATIALVVVPAFLSHFIWSSTLALVLYFPAFYAVEKLNRAKSDKSWYIPAIITIAAVMISQPSDNFFFGLLFGLMYLTTAIQRRSLELKIFFAGLFGLISSLVVYWIPLFFKYSWAQIDEVIGITRNIKDSSKVSGPWSRIYDLSHFTDAPLSNMFDNPTGFGEIVFWLSIIGSLIALWRLYKYFSKTKDYKSPKVTWYVVSLVWFVFCMLGTNSSRLPGPDLYPYRFWSKLAIPLVILFAEAVFFIYTQAKKKISTSLVSSGLSLAVVFYLVKVSEFNQSIKSIIFTILLITIASFVVISVLTKKVSASTLAKFFIIFVMIGIIATSGYPKHVVNNSTWMAHIFNSPDEMVSYTALRDLPINSKVYHLCNSGGMDFPEDGLIGMGMYNDFWKYDQRRAKSGIFNQSADAIRNTIKGFNYDYVAIDMNCINDYGLNATNDKLMELVNSGLYGEGVIAQPLIVLKVM